MKQKIRQAWNTDKAALIGQVEVDETYVGGKDKNRHENKRMRHGNSYDVKQAVIGMKSHVTNEIAAQPIAPVSARTLCNAL